MATPAKTKWKPARVGRSTNEVHEPQLDAFICARRGEEAIECYVHQNPEFARAFNTAAAEVDAIGGDRMYASTRRILIRLGRDGAVKDGKHLHRLGVSVLKHLGRHHRYLSWHRSNPRVPIAAVDAVDGGLRGEPLFAPGVDVDRVAATAVEPADFTHRAELFATILREAREVGLLYVRAWSIYRRYEFEFGRAHGAYVHLARLAGLDAHGCVVRLRSWRTVLSVTDRPAAHVIRQVRAIHHEARDRICATARRLGVDLPPRL